MTDLLKRGSPRLRWVGYGRYDVGPMFEDVASRAVDDLGLPRFRFSLQPDLLELPRDLRHGAPVGRGRALRSTFTRDAYLAAGGRAIEYIRAGDVFQVNLSQRFSVPHAEHP